jgi:hypothetical protein
LALGQALTGVSSEAAATATAGTFSSGTTLSRPIKNPGVLRTITVYSVTRNTAVYSVTKLT